MSKFKWKFKVSSETTPWLPEEYYWETGGTGWVFIGVYPELRHNGGYGELIWHDDNGLPWLKINLNSGEVLVHTGYAWDGCTPKWFWEPRKQDGSYPGIGTWDGAPGPHQGEYRAQFGSLVHDVLLQFHDRWPKGCHLQLNEFISKKEIDAIFRRTLRARGHGIYIKGKKVCSLDTEYWLVVRIFGGVWGAIAKHFTKRGKA